MSATDNVLLKDIAEKSSTDRSLTVAARYAAVNAQFGMVLYTL